MLHSIVPYIRSPQPPHMNLHDFIHQVSYCNVA